MATQKAQTYLNRLIERGAVLPAQPQRQDSLVEQLRDLVAVANRLGMYDASDFLNQVSNNPE